jgi:hypothetical protein
MGKLRQQRGALLDLDPLSDSDDEFSDDGSEEGSESDSEHTTDNTDGSELGAISEGQEEEEEQGYDDDTVGSSCHYQAQHDASQRMQALTPGKKWA